MMKSLTRTLRRPAGVRRAHVCPDDAARLVRRIGADPHLALEVALRRLARHVDALPGHVVLPAVVDAAQATLLVAAEEEAGAAVGAGLDEESHAAVRVAEGDEVLAQQPDAYRRGVGAPPL